MVSQDTLVYTPGRVYMKQLKPRGKAKTEKYFKFESAETIKSTKTKIKEWLQEKTLELKGFVDETKENPKVKVEVAEEEDIEMEIEEEEEEVEIADTDSEEEIEMEIGEDIDMDIEEIDEAAA